jgi:hypothetical protein
VKRRTEITVETDEVIIIRQSRRLSRAWCRECAQLAIMVTVDQAAAAAKKSSRLIYRMAEAGYIHFTETPEGFLLICFQSLVSAGWDDASNPCKDDAKECCERVSNKLKPV